MDTSTVIGIVVGVLVVVAVVVALLALRRRRTAQLRDRFGPEYERTTTASGRRDGERHLTDVADRRDSLEIVPLDAVARERYQERWTGVQAAFVERPGESVDDADRLVTDVMRDRGYPVDDVDQRADLLAADHPEVVEHYRGAQDARRRHHDAGGSATTEELRRAMVHYRELFDRLAGEGTERPDVAVTRQP